jgi:hypothetical protein
LNEKAGRAGDLETSLSSSALAFNAVLCSSIADRGRLPVALGKGADDEEEDCRAGNTKGGFGGGGFARGEACEVEGRACWEDESIIAAVV